MSVANPKRAASDPLAPDVRTFVKRHRVARLATADAQGRPHAVPIVYVLDASHLYFALDAKPKSVPPGRLRRVRNIAQNPRVAVIVDDYREDWRRLTYVLLEGEAAVLPEGAERDRALALLRAKYRQYRGNRLPLDAPVVRVTLQRAVSWGAV